MRDWTMTIPGPIPSTNHIYGYRGGRVYKKPGVEQFQTVTAHITRVARPKGWVPARRVRLTYSFSLERKMDADNLLKMLNDAIAAGLGIDDDCFLPSVHSKEVVKGVLSFVEVDVENVRE